ncbi:MAG: helix-turn-helix domain-containing protein [Pelodictyon phaeoclathratiforme]
MTLARARSQGKTLGRPHKTTEQQRSQIIEMRKNGQSVSALSRTFGISRASVMRITGDLS